MCFVDSYGSCRDGARYCGPMRTNRYEWHAPDYARGESARKMRRLAQDGKSWQYRDMTAAEALDAEWDFATK